MKPKGGDEPGTAAQHVDSEIEVAVPEGRILGADPRPLVGEVIDTEHPSRAGRVLVVLAVANGARVERWLPVLHGLSVRNGDRVLVVAPQNWAEAVVTGVIDGFDPRPIAPRHTKATLTLLGDEALTVTSAAGVPLAEVYQGGAGPVVRLLQSDVAVELAGALRITAQSVDLRARSGDVTLSADGDVVVRGSTILLN